MPKRLQMRTPPRLIVALVGLCYMWLSAALSFQHKDYLWHDTEALLAVSEISIQAAPPPLHSQLTPHSVPMPSAHCEACEWLASNVSPALPAFVVNVVPAPAPRSITTLPRYLGRNALPASSRGPPLA